jgi:hypothetical protein
MHEHAGEISDRPMLNGDKSVVIDQGSVVQLVICARDRIHLRLDIGHEIEGADVRVIFVDDRAIGTLQSLPDSWFRRFEALDEILGFAGDRDFGVRGRKHQQVVLGFRQFLGLVLDGEVRAQERKDVERDEREGDDRPATRRHLAMAQRDQHSFRTFWGRVWAEVYRGPSDRKSYQGESDGRFV